MLPDTVHKLPRDERFAYARLLAFMTRVDNELTVDEMAMFELENKRKESHWIWYIFPLITGLGKSEKAQFYSLKNFKTLSLLCCSLNFHNCESM